MRRGLDKAVQVNEKVKVASSSQSWYVRHFMEIPDPAVYHRRTLYVDSFKFRCGSQVQSGMENPTPGVFFESYNATDMSEAIYVIVPGEKAPMDGWWFPYCMIVVAGSKNTTAGMFWENPQADPQAVKDGGTISADGLFCPHFEYCDHYLPPVAKFVYAQEGLNIDFEKNDKNTINIQTSTTERFDIFCDEDDCVTSFDASFDLPVKGGPLKMSICMTFDDTKAPEGMEGKEF